MRASDDKTAAASEDEALGAACIGWTIGMPVMVLVMVLQSTGVVVTNTVVGSTRAARPPNLRARRASRT